ncbi:porin [Paraburkholderia caffeinilytica]|uniref:porin n=1 Tax=Paraburkholderia caffeinilytica TaxID=1761016 RepID=UPI0013BE9907|nr:porin [Paraburkholderia caffeinilytica]CAB3798660.1 Outer membrane porin protein 32 [Paraburkholderia caffeinilytica]
MKRRVSGISLAAISYFSCGTAYADRYEGVVTDSTTLYGIVNDDIDYVSTRSKRQAVSATRINSNSSRFGILGNEDLGGGLSAIFQIESKVNASTGTGAFAARETFVGLHGDFGALKLGNMDPPIDEVKGFYGNAPTGVTSILSTQAIINNNSGDAYGGSNAGANNGLPTMNDTMPNAIKYESPKVSNLYVDLMYARPTGQNPGFVPYNVGGDIVYADGRIKAALATQRNFGVRGPGLNDSTYLLTGGVTFWKTYAALVFSTLSADYTGGTVRRNFWGASVTQSVGLGKIYGFYGQAGNGSLDKPGMSQTGARMFELSYTYYLSKRTSIYTGFVRIINEANATYQLGVNGVKGGSTDAGAGVSGFIVGIKHNF